MSVISRNPFDLLGDDGDSSPAPVKTQPKTETPAAAPARTVPGSTPAGANNTNNANRGGRYPNRGGRGRGGATSGQQREDGPRNTAQVAGSGDIEGFETPGGFDGERVNPPKRAHHGPDRHTRTANDQPRISGGHTSSREGGRGGRGRGGSKTPAGGGERRVYERRSGGLPDSQKKVDLGWGANEGTAELTAEVEGEKDAQAEEAAPGTPAPEDETAADATPATPAAEAEPEEVQKSFDQFLAERAQSALGDGLGKKEGRTVNTETLEGKAFVREAIDDFFSGKTEKTVKTKAPKKEKVYIEVDGQFATPPGGGAGGRGGRGGDRGSTRGGGRGRGEGRGRGGPRGGAGARGGARSAQPQGINPSDDKAFPSLGA